MQYVGRCKLIHALVDSSSRSPSIFLGRQVVLCCPSSRPVVVKAICRLADNLCLRHMDFFGAGVL